METAMVHVRIEERIKAQASKTLAAMGLSVSDAVRILLTRVAAEQALPFDVRVPNKMTVKALQGVRRGEGKRHASAKELFEDLGI